MSDVLEKGLEIRTTSHGPSEEMLPIEPLRAWIEEWIAAEERCRRLMTVTGSRRGSDGTGGLPAVRVVAEALGLIDRRLHALRYDQKEVSIPVADRLLTNAGRDVTIFDLWPHLDDRAKVA